MSSISERTIIGVYYFILSSGGKNASLVLTFHAQERMRLWDLSEKRVLESLLYPEEVLIGHRERYIAHRRYGLHLVRVIYEYEGGVPVLITVYYPFADRYFEGGEKYADKILP